MKVIERRIGLLFAGFLLCFLVIAGRAFWLQGVQGSKLASEAAYQQTAAKLSNSNESSYSMYSSHVLALFNASWVKSWLYPTNMNYL